MAELRCPGCGSNDVEVHLECDAQGTLIPAESYGNCKKCGRRLSVAEVKAALGLK